MTGPFVRLLGDKGLASRYIRNAKQLLAKVHGIRRTTGVPVFAMRQLIPGTGAFIQAQSFGMIDVITIHALPAGGETYIERVVRYISSGIVFIHEGWRSGSGDFWQGITAPFVVDREAQANSTLGNATYFNAPWNGPATRNGASFFSDGTLLDEREMWPMHSHNFCREFDFHVVVQTTASLSTIYVGGVPVFDGSGVKIIGARMYGAQPATDEAPGRGNELAVAYTTGNILAVRYFQLESLTPGASLTHDEESEHVQIDLTMEVEPEGETSMFDFNPVNRGQGTFICSVEHTFVVTGGTERVCEYTFGRFDSSDETDPFLIEDRGEAIVRRTRTLRAGEFGALTGSSSTDYSFTGAPLADNMGGGSLSFTGGGAVQLLGSASSALLDTMQRWDNFTFEYGEASSPELLLGAHYPLGILGTTTNTRDAEWHFTMDRSGAVAATVENFPTWTGYSDGGDRYVRRVSGTGWNGITGTLSFDYTAYAENTTITSVIGIGYLDPSTPSGPYSNVVYSTEKTAGGKTGSGALDDEERGESTTCTLFRLNADEAWEPVEIDQVADYLYSRTGPALNAAHERYIEYADIRAVATLRVRTHKFREDTTAISIMPASGTLETTFPDTSASVAGNSAFAITTLGWTLAPNDLEFPPPYALVPGTHRVLEGAKFDSTRGVVFHEHGTMFAGSQAQPRMTHEEAVAAAGGFPSSGYGPLIRANAHLGPLPGVGTPAFGSLGPGGGDLTSNAGYISSNRVQTTPVTTSIDALYSAQRDVTINMTMTRVGNRCGRGGIYAAPIDAHVATPFAMRSYSAVTAFTDTPTKRILLVGRDMRDVTHIINDAKPDPVGVGVIKPLVTDDVFDTDLVTPAAFI